MIRKVFVALSVTVFDLAVAISILAHCGSTWVTQAPTFGPPLSGDGCIASSGSPTTTSKSVSTTIHWTVGPEKTVVITDSGQNKKVIGFLTDDCVRCFPIYEAPEWIDLGNGVTEWSQKTWMQTVGEENQCLQGFFRGAIDHHFGRDCSPGQDECESDFSWFWNPFSDSCQAEGPPPCDLFPEVCENGQWSLQWCGCVPYNTPIVLDLNGNGFNLTSSDQGVAFNLNLTGGKEQLAWTSVNSDDAWLVLDRNGNGTIDDGAELFGDVTAQPNPPAGEKRNGFRALAEYDKTSNGGNGNGQIDSGDTVFSSLRLWRDSDHNGLSESSELLTLQYQNVASIELDYKHSKKTDNHGNQFSFRAKIKTTQGHQLGRWAWDVYLLRSVR